MTSKTLILGAVALCTLTVAGRASTINSQAFSDIGATKASTGDILTATTFTLGNLVTTAGELGVFVGMPTQIFGMVTLDTTSTTALTLSSAVFGTFTSTSIMNLGSTIGGAGATQAFDFKGEWTPGTFSGFSGLTGGPLPADLTISFTQTPAHSGVISASITFAVTPVPEPGALEGLLLGTGMLGLAEMTRRKLRLGT